MSAWIKEARDDHHKTFKAVLPNCTADHEGIINLTTDNITSTLGTTAFTTAEYCCRIAGVLAGLSLARSCTYFELSDITAADVPEDADERIDNGELVIVFDGEEVQDWTRREQPDLLHPGARPGLLEDQDHGGC